MPKFAAALAARAAGTRNAKLALVGDSTVRGNGSATTTGQALNGWGPQLSDLLTNGGLPSGWSNIFGAGNVTLSSYDARIVNGWGLSAAETFGGKRFTGATGTVSFTPQKLDGSLIPFDTIDFWIIKNTGLGTFDVNVDGGATIQTISNANATPLFTKVTVTVPGGLTTHTINCVRSTLTVFINGIDCYTAATKQVSIWNGGRSGWMASDFIADQSSVDRALPALGTLAPDLTIISTGINEWESGQDTGTMVSAISTIADTAAVSGDVVLATPVPSSTAVAAVATQDTYVAAIRALAASRRYRLIDNYALFGSYATANANGWMTDTKHPNGTGYAQMAANAKRVLGL
jgi:lysophospholipase L1-like esterase